MHIIQDIEGFFKDLETTVYAWFGTGKNGEEGKEAIKSALALHITPIMTGTLIPVETPVIPDEQPDAIIEAPIEIETSIEDK
jgi:hypothetical protein